MPPFTSMADPLSGGGAAALPSVMTTLGVGGSAPARREPELPTAAMDAARVVALCARAPRTQA